jgi:hypothetical protein
MKDKFKLGCITTSVLLLLFSCGQPRKREDSNVKPKVIEIKSNLNDFQQRKVEFLDSEYLYKGPDGNKQDYLKKAKLLTKDLLTEYRDSIINWDVRLTTVILETKDSDKSLLKTMSPNDVVKKDPTGRTMAVVFETDEYQPKFGKFWVTLTQESNKVTPKNSIKTTDVLYQKIADMTTGLDKAMPEIIDPEKRLKITAKVLAFEDYLNEDESHNTILYIQLIDIK